MTKEQLLDQLQQVYNDQLELKEQELMILSQLAELDERYSILYSWVSNDLKFIYKENDQ